MIYKEISISGFRGFNESKKIELAIPNRSFGSGLTILVGENNSGKTTILESFRLFSVAKQNQNSIDISLEKRNKRKNKISIKLLTDKGEIKLETKSNGARITLENFNVPISDINIYSAKARRDIITSNTNLFSLRKSQAVENKLSRKSQDGNTIFWNRISEIIENEDEKNLFSKLINDIIGKELKWDIELIGESQYYIKCIINDIEEHDAEGIGEGILSVLVIAEKLFKSQPGDLIIIDEPELSIHPKIQKRLLNKILEFSEKIQIIVATHSSYFISWDALENDGKLIRVTKTKDDIEIYTLKKETITSIQKIRKNIQNPHILGLNAKEIFFVTDNVILVEGQEDVIYYKKLLDKYNININADFFGWGMGGADNCKNILDIFKDLGYCKVACIFDRDRKENIEKLEEKYEGYKFFSIEADDIRDKQGKLKTKEVDKIINILENHKISIEDQVKTEIIEEIKEIGKKEGLLDKEGKIKDEKIEGITKDMFRQLEKYFQ